MELLEALKNMPDDVAKATHKKMVPKGKILMQKGDPVKYIYVLLRGRVQISKDYLDGRHYIFATRDKQSLLGEFELLSSYDSYWSTVTCETDCELLLMPAKGFRAWLRRDTEFFFTVARIFADAVGATMTQLGNIKYIPAQERFSSYLLEETREMGREITIRTTRRQIADEIGMSIRTLQRCIDGFAAQGSISLVHGKIHMTAEQRRRLLEDADGEERE